MRLRHLKTVERRKVSQPSRNTAPPPPLYRGGVVVVERAPPAREGGGFITLSGSLSDWLHRSWEPVENRHPACHVLCGVHQNNGLGGYSIRLHSTRNQSLLVLLDICHNVCHTSSRKKVPITPLKATRKASQ